MGVLDALLEGFAAAPAGPDFHGQFTPGDQVRVAQKGSSEPVTGRVVRFHKDTGHAIVAPGSGQPHVRAELGSLSFDSPANHAAAAKRAKDEAMKAAQQAPPPKPGAPPAAGKVREADIGVLVEAFKLETPAQSQQRGQAAVTAAKAELGSGAWNASKHPRATGGKFGYTTGGKRATRSSSAARGRQSRVLSSGAAGPLVSAIQRQIGVAPSGHYDRLTVAAVERFQRQHRLQVDGIVGRQTLAALRGHSEPWTVQPGPIPSSAARVLTHPSHRVKRGARGTGAPTRIGGGRIV